MLTTTLGDIEIIPLNSTAQQIIADGGRVLVFVVPATMSAIVRLQEYEPLDAADERLLEIVRDINRRTGEPATTATIVQASQWAETTVRERLKKMEDGGAISRPSERGGWVAIL